FNLPTNLLNNVSTSTAVNDVFSISTATLGTGMSMVMNIPQNIVNNISTGTLGNNFNISTSTRGTGNALVINFPNANITNNGQFLASDWLTFNNKLSGSAAVNQITYFTGASTTAGS